MAPGRGCATAAGKQADSRFPYENRQTITAMTQHSFEIHTLRKGVLPRRIRTFIEMESASGMVMIVFALLALIVSNSPLSAWYNAFVAAPVTFGYRHYIATEPLQDWVKDILMVLFFLMIGLELKREMREGFLSKRDQITLPLLAAMGGMAAPAAIFFVFNHQVPDNLNGWAIPCATDIAFALAILTLFGRRVPPSVKIFLLAVAIFDDLGAILIIVAFYNAELAAAPLLLAAGGMAALITLNRAGVTVNTPYIIVGIFLWFCLYHAGIHTTLAGILVGFAIPMRDAQDLRHSPLNTCMHFLHPWVSFLVLPVFAFTNAGVDLRGLSPSSFIEPLPLGIALGLFFGKQIGIFGVSWLLIRSKQAAMPEAAGWIHLYAVSVIAGVGFTMSLFLGLLAFPDDGRQEMVKLGVIGGSLLSIMWGTVVLRLSARAKQFPSPP